ncbi:MAG TPA: mannose-6-phosphate isomerase, partial [Verrucomicrobiae bacterium]|nr:mannose-6-phosphate isomerase [Verrucomicrobiae bacterium]
MPQLYPFLVVPIFDERPWGVRDLRPVYTRVVNEPIGESWLTWEDNRVANGPLAGQSIGDLAKKYRRDLVGQVACYEDRFPLLIKFLFPGDKLSVQVH